MNKKNVDLKGLLEKIEALEREREKLENALLKGLGREQDNRRDEIKILSKALEQKTKELRDEIQDISYRETQRPDDLTLAIADQENKAFILKLTEILTPLFNLFRNFRNTNNNAVINNNYLGEMERLIQGLSNALIVCIRADRIAPEYFKQYVELPETYLKERVNTIMEKLILQAGIEGGQK